MWMLPSAYEGVMSTPGVSQCRDYTSGYCVWAQASGWPCRTLALRCLLLPTQHSGGACLSSPIPSWDCSEELKGCSKGLRFLSLFLAICGERRITALTFLTFVEYCLTVLFHARILILLSAKTNYLGLFYFNTGNPKQWEEHAIM